MHVKKHFSPLPFFPFLFFNQRRKEKCLDLVLPTTPYFVTNFSL